MARTTPLNREVTGIVERDAYTIEKVIFESRPQFFVTANLYVPKGRKADARRRRFVRPLANGKAAETYQSFAQGLARQGYVVLIFDPIGQGERLQYPDEHLQNRTSASASREHFMAATSSSSSASSSARGGRGTACGRSTTC